MATDVRAVLIRLIGKNETKKTFASINKSLAGIKRGVAQMGKFTVAAGAAAGVLANMGAEFSIKMAEVNTMLDDSGETVAKFKKEILALAKETGKAPLELAEALRQTLSAGVDAGDAMKFLKKSTKAAIGGVAETIQVVDLATSALDTFGRENITLDKILSVTQQSIKLGKTTYVELAESMGVLFQPATAIGLTFEDISAALVTLTKGGVKTVNGITQLKAVMSGVLKTTPAVRKEAKRLGIDFTVAGLKAKGLIGFMKEIQDKTKGDKEAIATLIPNVRAMGAAFTLTGRQAEGAQITLEKLNASLDENGKAFRKVADDAGFKFKKSLNAIRTAAVELGVVLLPIINETVKSTVSWVQQNEVLTKSVFALTAALVILKTSGIAAVVLGLGQMAVTAIAAAVTAIPAAITAVIALNAATGSLAITIGVLLVPVIVIAAKIALVAAAGYAAGRGIAFLLEKFAPEKFKFMVDSMTKIGELLGAFEESQVDKSGFRIDQTPADRARINREIEEQNRRSEQDDGGLGGESRQDGKLTGQHLRMAVKENQDQFKEGVLEGMRSGNTQLAGAIQAGSNGI